MLNTIFSEGLQDEFALAEQASGVDALRAIAARFDVVLLNGGRLPVGTRVPAGVRRGNLPPRGPASGDSLVSHFDTAEPHVVIVRYDERMQPLVRSMVEERPGS